MNEQKPILHGRDHMCGGADPIPGICDLFDLIGNYEDAIRNEDLTVWYQLGDTFTFASSVSDALVDVADFDLDSPRNLDYTEASSSNRPTLQVAEAVDEDDPGAIEFNWSASSGGPEFSSSASELDDVTQFGTTADLAQTVSCWAKVKDGLGSIYGPVCGRWGMDGTGSNNVGWVIEIEQDTYVLRFRAKPTISIEYLITGPTLTVDTWYHIAVTWDGTTWILYVNGAAYDDTTGTSAPVDPSTTGGFRIGGPNDYDSGATSAERWFYGSVDSVAFWRRVLTPTEIAAIAAGAPPPALTEAVESISKAGDTPLTGDVTLSEGANVTLTQVGQDIEIAASTGGGGGGGSDTELDYVENTSGLSVTATSEATAQTYISSNSVSLDGSTRIKLEVFIDGIVNGNSGSVNVLFYDGSTCLGIVFRVLAPSGAGQYRFPAGLGVMYLTPSNGSHTFHVKAYRGTANGNLLAGAGGTDVDLPSFLRVSEA